MKIKSAGKNSVNYPLKKELAPALLSVALSVAGYAADFSEDNGTKGYSAKAIEQQETELHRDKHFDVNNTFLSFPWEKHKINNNSKKVVPRKNIEKPTIVLGYSSPTDHESDIDENVQYENENLVINNTSLSLSQEKYQIDGNTEKAIQKILKLDTPWKKVEKPSTIVGYSSPTYEDILFKF